MIGAADVATIVSYGTPSRSRASTQAENVGSLPSAEITRIFMS